MMDSSAFAIQNKYKNWLFKIGTIYVNIGFFVSLKQGTFRNHDC